MPEHSLLGLRLLLVEDEYLVATMLADGLRHFGATIIGPVPSVARAMDAIGKAGGIDCALLDLNLGGEPAFPLIDDLRARGTPCLLLTGYDAGALPPAYRTLPRLTKPCSIDDVVYWIVAARGA